ncbi:MAG TPA: anti-sigma factor [Xanthobacteraceae bacterium]|nr:anti-sigma factor [Xanthobacteraceae bacterium]
MYDDAQDALAAEYVLGTLSADEREHAEALLTLDPGFAASVRMWERRLGELNVMVEAVEPPPELWDKIKAELGSVEPSSEAPPAAAVSATPLLTMPEPPVETPLETPPAESPPLIMADEPGTDSIAIPPPVGELPEAVSDSIAASLAKTLAEPAEERAERVAPPLVIPPDVEPKGEPRDERSANVVQLSRRVSRWRRITVVMGTIAALLALYIGLAQFAPGLVPLGPRAPVVAQSTAPAQLGARLVAVLQQEPTAPAFLLTVDPQSRTLVVRRVSATPEAGRSYELWLISSQFPTPKSLGVVGNDEFTQRPIPGNFDVATLRTASYAVSLEPSGGSPSGVPTGPVLFTGKIVESVPTAAPAPRT